MKRGIQLIVCLLMCFLLTGCYGAIVNVTINSNESGTVAAKIGFSQKAYEMMKSLEGNEGTSESDMQDMEPFYYNGKTYYGSNQTLNFANISEFNSKMVELNESEEVDSGIFNLSKDKNNNYTLTLTINSESANTAEIKENMSSMDITQQEKDALMRDMVMVYSFFMPSKVNQISGDSAGITITNNVVKIDFLKLDIPKESGVTKTYSFTTTPEKNTSRFSDVPATLWSYKAINVLADGGLVAGVGEGRFSPERGMKISEFCQVLVNATGLESGSDESGYWAAKAIKSCIDKGYIYSHGEIKPEIYDAVITREEAIAAMQIASGRPPLSGKNVSINDIPDGAQIADKYKELVVQAYNSGITTGVNEQLKFSPKNQLTRGQVCQLFFNVDWTTPIKR